MKKGIETRNIQRMHLIRGSGLSVNKKQWTRALVSIAVLSLFVLSPCLTQEASAETRMTITITAGGVACGVYFFLSYGIRASMSVRENYTETTAPFNFTREGWQIRFPELTFMESGYRNTPFLVHAPQGVQLNVLSWRF